jgi:trimeric autotransporter adhesin
MRNRILFTLIALLGVVGCSDSVTAPEVLTPTTIEVVPVAAQLERGATTTLAAKVLDQFGNEMTDVEVLWESNNTTVATVTSAGVVTARAVGEARITAISGALRAHTTVFVVAESVATVSIDVTLPAGGLVVGNSVPATATALSARGDTITGFATTWTSSAPTVATVSASGVITAVAEGASTITATIAGVSATTTVTTRLVPVSSVVLAADTIPARVGRTAQVKSTLLSAGGDTLTASQRSLTWASSDTTVATVSSTGVVTGVGVGTTRISLIAGSAGAAPVVGLLDVAVTQVPIADVEIVADTTDLVIGDRREYVARALDANDNVLTALELDGRTFSWSVSSAATTTPIIATPGVTVTHIRRWYTAVAEGIADIVATITGVSATVQVEVVAPAP